MLRRKIRKAADPTTADIAIHLYDLDEIANRLTASADYAGLITLLAADLAPERIVTAQRAGQRRRWCKRKTSAEDPPTPEPTASPAPTHPAADTSSGSRHEPESEPTRALEPAPHNDDRQQPAEGRDLVPTNAVTPPDRPATTSPASGNNNSDDITGGADVQRAASGGVANDEKMPTTTAEAVAYWLRKEPNLAPELLAERIGRSLRSVYRYLPPDYPRRPGVARQRIDDSRGPHDTPSRRG